MKDYKIRFGFKAVLLKANSYREAVEKAAPILGYSLTDTMVKPLLEVVQCGSMVGLPLTADWLQLSYT